jgi:hypothetical protein
LDWEGNGGNLERGQRNVFRERKCCLQKNTVYLKEE